MKKLILTLALVIAMSVPAFADTTIGDWATAKGTADYAGTQVTTGVLVGKSANGIVYSRHNLSSYGEHYQATTSVTGTSTATVILPNNVITTEVCVFCHTPHFGRTDTAPIWNRGSSMTGFTAYGTGGFTLAGSVTGVGGSSLACLSCHDGVTTFDNLINKPGKGSRTNGTGVDQGWVFGEIGTGDTIGDTTAGGDVIGGATKGASRLNIGAGQNEARSAANVDLSNDHPISVSYLGNLVASLRDNTTLISGITMDNARSNGNDTTRNIYGRSDNLWSVKGFISNTAVISDLLRDGNKVQCASCHDPHYKNQTNTDPSVVASYKPTGYVGDYPIDGVDSDGLFLRRVGGNSNSGVCRTCHNK